MRYTKHMRAPREKTFSLRPSAEEWESAHAVASAEGLTLSDWIRTSLRRAASRPARKTPAEAVQP